MSVRVRQRRMGAFTATTRGHLEERKQEMPDVHQPDLSVAGGAGGKSRGTSTATKGSMNHTHSSQKDLLNHGEKFTQKQRYRL